MATKSLPAFPLTSTSRRRPYDYYYQVKDQTEDGFGRGSRRSYRQVEAAEKTKKPPAASFRSSVRMRGGSYSYGYSRVERARKRQIFLRNYNLSFERETSVSGKVRRSIVKVKNVVVSAVGMSGWSFFATCRRICGPQMGFCVCSSSSPRPVVVGD